MHSEREGLSRYDQGCILRASNRCSSDTLLQTTHVLLLRIIFYHNFFSTTKKIDCFWHRGMPALDYNLNQRESQNKNWRLMVSCLMNTIFF